MKPYLAIASLAVLLTTGNLFAQNTPQDEAYKRIATASHFAVGGIGRGGAISNTEKDLWRLIQAKDEKTLLALTREKNPAAQLYGFLGLKYLGSSQQKNLSNTLTKSSGKVEVISGCIVHHQKISVVATEIASGIYNDYLKNDAERKP